MAEFLRLKLMPLEKKLKVTQSEWPRLKKKKKNTHLEGRSVAHFHFPGVMLSFSLFLCVKILQSPRDKSRSRPPTNHPSPSQEWPSLRTAAEPPSVLSCN